MHSNLTLPKKKDQSLHLPSLISSQGRGYMWWQFGIQCTLAGPISERAFGIRSLMPNRQNISLPLKTEQPGKAVSTDRIKAGVRLAIGPIDRASHENGFGRRRMGDAGDAEAANGIALAGMSRVGTLKRIPSRTWLVTSDQNPPSENVGIGLSCILFTRGPYDNWAKTRNLAGIVAHAWNAIVTYEVTLLAKLGIM